jgi:hypothetical protein
LTRVFGVVGCHDGIAVQLGARDYIRLDSAERALLVLWLERDPASRGLTIAFLGVGSMGVVVLDPTSQLELVGAIDRWLESLAAASPVPPLPAGVNALRRALLAQPSQTERATTLV